MISIRGRAIRWICRGWKYLAEVAKKQMEEIRPKDAGSLADFRETMEPALRHMLATEMPKADDVIIERDGERTVISRAGSAERLPVALLHPTQEHPPITIVISAKGKAGIYDTNVEPTELAKALVAKGYLVGARRIFS